MQRFIALRGEYVHYNVVHLQHRAFITFGKQTIYAKQCGDSTQTHV